jgi:hypothetical protein
MSVTAKISTQGIDRLLAKLTPEGMKPCLKRVLEVYQQFVMARFMKNMHGGGDWQGLAESTIYGRERAKRGAARRRAAAKAEAKGKSYHPKRTMKSYVGTGAYSILNDTGVLLKGLSIGQAGNLTRYGQYDVTYGLADTPHPSKSKGAHASIQKIAGYHNTGGDRLPKRVILPKPDDATKGRMLNRFMQHVGMAPAGGGR